MRLYHGRAAHPLQANAAYVFARARLVRLRTLIILSDSAWHYHQNLGRINLRVEVEIRT